MYYYTHKSTGVCLSDADYYYLFYMDMKTHYAVIKTFLENVYGMYTDLEHIIHEHYFVIDNR